jgi:hypothetical protein
MDTRSPIAYNALDETFCKIGMRDAILRIRIFAVRNARCKLSTTYIFHELPMNIGLVWSLLVSVGRHQSGNDWSIPTRSGAISRDTNIVPMYAAASRAGGLAI